MIASDDKQWTIKMIRVVDQEIDLILLKVHKNLLLIKSILFSIFCLLDSRAFDRGSGGNWSSTSEKPFSSNNPTMASKSWSKDSWRPGLNTSNSERWNSSSSRGSGLTSGPLFSGNSINMGPSCPPPPGINNYVNDRFEYKNIGNMRKY